MVYVQYIVRCNPKKILKHIVQYVIKSQKYEIINNNFFLTKEAIPTEMAHNIIEFDGIYYNKYIFNNWRKLWININKGSQVYEIDDNINDGSDYKKDDGDKDKNKDEDEDNEDNNNEDYSDDEDIDWSGEDVEYDDENYIDEDYFSDDNSEEEYREYIKYQIFDNDWDNNDDVRNIFNIFFNFYVYDQGVYFFPNLVRCIDGCSKLSEFQDFFGDDNVTWDIEQFIY